MGRLVAVVGLIFIGGFAKNFLGIKGIKKFSWIPSKLKVKNFREINISNLHQENHTLC